MVWGAIHHGCRSELVVVDGAMNWHPYIQILRNQMLPWATGVFGRKFVYIKDNAWPNTARDTAAFLDQQDVEVMDWPARSPDVNTIEHVWDQISVWIRDMDDPPSTVTELNNAIRQAWAIVWHERVWTLFKSLPSCVWALLATRGRDARYKCRGQKGNVMFHQYVVNCFNVPYWSLVLASKLEGCAPLAWFHTLPAYCHQFDDTICICAAISHINL